MLGKAVHLTVKKVEEDTSDLYPVTDLQYAPNTGDNMPIIPIVILGIAALGGIILIIRRKLV